MSCFRPIWTVRTELSLPVDQQRPQVLVPRGQEAEHPEGRQCGPGQRHGHRARGTGSGRSRPAGAASRRSRGICRKACRSRKVPNPVARNGTVSPGKVLNHPSDDTVDEVGGDRHLERDHERHEEHHEERALEGEVEEGEGVGGEDRRDELAGHDDRRLDGGVPQVDGEVTLGPGLAVGPPLGMQREERRRLVGDLAGGEQRVHDRHVQGEQHDHRAEREQGVAEHEAQPAVATTWRPDGGRGAGRRSDGGVSCRHRCTRRSRNRSWSEGEHQE